MVALRWLCHANRGQTLEEERKEVEASLDIKDVIYQTPCFSKTIVSTD